MQHDRDNIYLEEKLNRPKDAYAVCIHLFMHNAHKEEEEEKSIICSERDCARSNAQNSFDFLFCIFYYKVYFINCARTQLTVQWLFRHSKLIYDLV